MTRFVQPDDMFSPTAQSRNRAMTQLSNRMFFIALVVIAASGCTQPFDPTQDSSYVPPGSGEEIQLEHGYSRIGKYVLFEGKRIDLEGASTLMAALRQPQLKLASNPDGETFEVLSEEYTKDKNMVYYKWGSPGRFWVIEMPEADPETIEQVSFNLAKDKSKVWYYGEELVGLDPRTLTVVNPGFVWKDSRSVWYQRVRLNGADPDTFEHVGQAFYKDKNRAYWSATPLEGADPNTFRAFGNNSAHGVDKNSVWFAKERAPELDPATFDVVHHMVYKDKSGVYCNGVRIPDAKYKTMRKVVDLNEHLSALLTDGDAYFVYVAGWTEVYRVEPMKNWLRVTKDVWEGKPPNLQNIGKSSALLTKLGWQKFTAPESKAWGKDYWKQREATTLTQFKDCFKRAWEIITGKEKEIGESRELARIMNTPVDRDYKTPVGDDFDTLQTYRATQRKFDDFYRRWLELNPKIKAQIEAGASIDVAEVFAVEMFGLADSKMPMADLLSWKDIGTKLLLDMVEVQRRNLRPPTPESPLLRDELIRQVASVSTNNQPDLKRAETLIDKQIDQWRILYPGFLYLKPKDEKTVSSNKLLADVRERIKTAKALFSEYDIQVTKLVDQLLVEYRVGRLNAVQTELLAQLMTAEARRLEASLTK